MCRVYRVYRAYRVCVMSSLFMHDLCEICESTLIRWPGEGKSVVRAAQSI